MWTTDHEPVVLPEPTAQPNPVLPGSPKEWNRAEVDGHRLQIHYGGSACQVSDDARVVESSAKVVVTVFVVDSRRICTLQLVGHDILATLDAPLGDRILFDGACLERTASPDDAECRRRPA